MIALKKLQMIFRNLRSNKSAIFLNCVGKSRMHLHVADDLPIIDPKRMQVSNISNAF